MCLGFKPGAAELKAQTNPLSYGGNPFFNVCLGIYNNENLPNSIKIGHRRFKILPNTQINALIIAKYLFFVVKTSHYLWQNCIAQFEKKDKNLPNKL